MFFDPNHLYLPDDTPSQAKVEALMTAIAGKEQSASVFTNGFKLPTSCAGSKICLIDYLQTVVMINGEVYCITHAFEAVSKKEV